MTADAEIFSIVEHIRRRPLNPYLPAGWLPFAVGPSCDPVVLAEYIRVWERRAREEAQEAA